MSNFQALEFSFNNISCKQYNLKIASLDSNGVEDRTSQTLNIITARTNRRQNLYDFRVSNSETLKFTMGFMREEPILAKERAEIIKWLSSGGNFGILRICQEDMETLYYRCIFQEIKDVTIGNVCYGFTAEIMCDSPYAYGSQSVYEFDESYSHFVVNNTSSDFVPIPAQFYFTITAGNSVKLFNQTTNETMQISGLSTNDSLLIDTNLQFIKLLNDSTKILIDKFDGDFIKLAQGVNHFYVQDGLFKLTVKFDPVFVVGG